MIRTGNACNMNVYNMHMKLYIKYDRAGNSDKTALNNSHRHTPTNTEAQELAKTTGKTDTHTHTDRHKHTHLHKNTHT